MVSRAAAHICSGVTEFWSLIFTSPISTTLFVVAAVSTATRASGSFEISKSTMASEIWSHTLSG